MIDFKKLNYTTITSDQMPTETMQELADMCGIETAILLMEHFGGRALVIPSKRETDLYGEIIAVCGIDATDKIFSAFSGEAITIPMRREALRLIIHQLAIDAAMLNYLIYTYGTTRSTIYRMLQDRPKVIVKDGNRYTFNTIEDYL